MAWFGNPLNKSLLGIPANRATLGVLMRALMDKPDSATNQVFDAASGLEWEPYKPTDSVGVGLVWNSNTADAMHLGFGANASIDITGDQKLDLGLVARMLSFSTTGDVSTEFGQALFTGSFAVPKFFMNSASITGSYTNSLAFTLAAEKNASVSDLPKRARQSQGLLSACSLRRNWSRVQAPDTGLRWPIPGLPPS